MTARLLTLSEAAAQLRHVSEHTLRRMTAEGKFPARRIGRKLVVSQHQLDQWVDADPEFRKDPA